MAKGSRGGKRSAAGGTAVGMSGGVAIGSGVGSPQTQNQQVQVDDTQQAKPMSANYDAFMAMSDDQKATAIDSMVSQQTPDFLSDSALQRMTYNMKLNDKPQLVDDATLDSMTGTELFRTVNAVYDRKNDISYKADEIAAQIQKGSVTRYSDSGGSVYGRGLYFANDYGGSSAYGNTTGNVKATAMVRCKLNSNAKTIGYSQAKNGLYNEIQSGSKLGKSLSKISRTDSDSAVSIYAMSKGYNVITSGNGYFNILNRNAVTMSSSVKAINRNYKW